MMQQPAVGENYTDMRKVIKDWFLGGQSISIDADYQAVLDRATTLGYTLPSVALRQKQSQLVSDLKDYGVWTLIDILYVFRNNDSTLGNFSKLNWKSPSDFEITHTSAPTYTVNGWDGNGTSNFLTTNWAPSANGVNYLLNNASSFGGQIENASGQYPLWGASDAGNTNYTLFIPRNASNLIVYSVNSTNVDTFANLDSSGFWQTKRTAATAHSIFLNGSLIDSGPIGSSGRTGAAVTLLALNTNGTVASFSPNTITCYGAGSSMSTQQSADLYTSFNTYFTSL